MTYCVAWKKDKTIYMIADAAISAKIDKVESKINTFGEVQGLYGNYNVQEGILKIYKITSNFAIAYAGNISQCKEIIENIYSLASELNIKELMNVIENSYNEYDVEMIFIFSDAIDNHIYKFAKGSFKEDNYIEIGIGKDIPYLSQDIQSIANKFYRDQMDKQYYLAGVISIIQCYMLRNKTFGLGVGGVISGILLDKQLKWFRDIEYCLLEDDIREIKSMSVINRFNSVFSSSDLDGTTRGIINEFKDIEIWNDLYQRRGIIKALNTKNAFYYVFYSFKYNVMYFMETNGYLHNIHFRRYVRRDEKKSDYAYLFRPDFNKHFIKYDSHDARMLSVVEMEVKSLGYIPHEEMLKQCNNQDVIDRCKYMEYDFEFSESEFRDFNKSLVKDIKEIIEDYHNIVLVDYQYFCDAIEEKINQYKKFRTFTIDDINLKAIVDQFMKQMVGDSFEKYVFYAIKPFNYKKNISGYDIDKYFKKYNNFKILDTDNYENDFLGVVFQIMKNYYINEKFFHIDKYIIIADNIKVRELLDIITPKFNFGSENPDILLVRNLNGLTEMNGILRYMVIDYVVAAILGLTIEEFGQLEALSYDI